MSRAKRRIGLYGGAALLGAGILLLGRGRPGEDAPAGAAPAPCPAAVPPSPAARLEARLEHYHRLQEMKASLDDLVRTEREIEAMADGLGPGELVGTLFGLRFPAGAPLVLRALEAGLARDRGAWEEAIVAGLKGLEGPRLEGQAALLLDRLRGEEARGAVAMDLLGRARTEDRLHVLAARYAAGPATARVREALWERVPAPGAVEGLGLLVEPAEAARLASLGPRPEVARALEAAWERTKDPAFREALARPGR